MALRLIVVVVVMLGGLARAQSPTTGGIQGVVTEPSGDAAPGVTVVVTASGVSTQSAITDEHGAYKITNLPPGTYLVTFYYIEQTFVRSDIIVGVQKITPVYLKLKPGEAKGEVVHIQGHAPTIDPTSTAQGITIDKDYLKNIPVPGRTFTAALGAAPGSQGDILGVAFSGSTSLENQYYVDGVNTTGLSYGTVGSPVINDFIEEIEIITGGYNAEFGRATGGIVNVVTKSGSNELRGSVFGYMQPGFLTAPAKSTPFNARSIDVTGDVGYRADVGFEIGGPIKKDKLWFYVGFAPQVSRIDYTRTTKSQTDCRTTQNDGSMSLCDARLVADGGFADGAPDVDPSTGYFVTEDIDSEVRSHTSRIYNTLAKINYAYNPRQQGQLAVSFVPFSTRRPNLFGPEQQGNKYSGKTTDISTKWTSKLFDDKTELEATIGLHRDSFNMEAIDATQSNMPIQILVGGTLGTWGPGFGESASTNRGCQDGGTTSSDKYPFISNCPMDNQGYYIGGPGSVYKDIEQRRSARFGITQRVKAAGQHELKAGIDAEDNVTHNSRALSGNAFIINRLNTQVDVERWVQITDDANTDPRFDQTCTSNDPATGDQTKIKCDFLGGIGTDGTIVRDNTFNWATYVRDSWQIRPNITLNVGLRYEEQRLRFAEFLQGQVDPVTGDRYGKNALVLKGEWAPRLGALYDWTKEGRSKVYAHWGRFYESIPLEINDYNFGQPVISLQTYNPTQCGMTDAAIGGPNGLGCANTSATPGLRDEVFGANGSLVAPGVRGQYIDEVVAGTEYEFLDDFKLGISLQSRRFGRVIDDVSVDGANTYIVANPGTFPRDEETKLQHQIDGLDDADPDKARLQKQLDMFKGIRIFDKPRRDYSALQMTMSRRFKKQLYVQASYTYSRTAGNYPGLINYDDNVVLPNNSTQFDLIELLANRIGPLPQDRPHYIKLDGYYTIDRGKVGAFTVGARFRALSGVPENALGPHYLYGDNQSFLLPRGTIGRASFEHGLDLHVGYARSLKRSMKVEFFVDVYNVYDSQGTAGVDNSYAGGFKQASPGSLTGSIQNANPVSGGSYEDLVWVKTIDQNGSETNVPIGRNPNFLNTISRYGPAYGRLGARLTF